ncbi:DNA-binding GntR family transcriptional regulator [Streptomyces sp. V3I8]|uniref:UTRA domain-containing protein n=1 Tax=Streptomyces sp. V3I8 TaxID=3042279 RepID=UPI0027828FC2|nr:UTRA domain-containing protein [Streptomyces sp. V3I8]MDQ1033648.1 DNA-binding GntR family transcriptional regulator [Streptomyces sp. V3I8]
MATNEINETGTIVRDARTRYATAQREENGARGAFDAELQRSGLAPRSEVSVSRATAPADVAELLGTDGEVVVRDRQMFAGDRLVQLATTFIPVDVAEAAGIEQVDTGIGGIISRMKEAGFDQGDAATEDVALRPATADEAARLGLAEGSDVLTINHIGRATADGRVVEVTQHVLAKGWTLQYSVPLA